MADKSKNYDNNEKNPAARKSGGLYKNIKVSVKTVNIVICVAIVALLLSVAFSISHNGFTVTFDTDGGSHIEEVTVLHGETVPISEDPVKEGYSFKGWYLDKAKTYEWKTESEKVTESITLYAGWEKEME